MAVGDAHAVRICVGIEFLLLLLDVVTQALILRDRAVLMLEQKSFQANNLFAESVDLGRQ